MEYYNQHLIKESHYIYKKYNKNDSKTLFFKENKNDLLYQCDTFFNSLLHIFIECDDIDGFEAMYCFLKDLINTSKTKNIDFVKKVINLQNINGDTAVHIAARKSKGEDNKFTMIIELLENLGADLSIPNKKNEVIKKIGENNYNKEIQDMKNKIKNCLFSFDDNEDTNFDDDDGMTSSVFEKESSKPQYQDKSRFRTPPYLDNITTIRTSALFGCSNQPQQKILFDEDSRRDFRSPPTSARIEEIREQDQTQRILQGGKQNSETSSDSELIGNRILNNPYIDIEGGSKKANEIHNEIISIIQNKGYSLDEAKDIKNFIYYEIKERYPDLNNDEKASKMKEIIDKKLKNININEIKIELQKYRERRDANIEKKPKEKKEKKEKKPKEKKEKKNSKRLSKKTSKKTSKKKKKNLN